MGRGKLWASLCALLVCLPVAVRADAPEVFVDEPVTLASVRALQSQGMQVSIEKRKESATAAGPCHGAACAFYLPFLLLPAAEYQQALVRNNGELVYEASFTADGEFIEATRYSGEVAIGIGRLQLPVLQRDLIVALRRFNPKDFTQPSVRVSLQPQVNLLGAYRRALTQAADGEKRAQLLRESAVTIEHEALPLLSNAVGANAGDVQLMASLTDAACLWTQHEPRDELWRTLAARKQWQVALQLLRCEGRTENYHHAEPVPEDVLALAYQIYVGGLCGAEATTIVEATERLERFRLVPEHWPLAEAALSRCSNTRIGGLRAMWRQPVSDQQARDSYLVFDALFPQVLKSLAERPDGSRPLLVSLLAVPSKFQRDVLALLERDRTPIRTAAEMRLLARAYATNVSPPMRAALLEAWSHRSPSLELKPADRSLTTTLAAVGLSELSTALASAKPQDRAMLEIALVVLGEHKRATSAARALGPFTLTSYASTLAMAMSKGSVDTPQQLVVYGLRLAGCEPEGVVSTHRKAATSAADISDSGCTQP